MGDDRILRKQKSREYAKANCISYKDNWSEDMCDAFCMTYFLNEVISTEQAHANVKRAKALKYDANRKAKIKAEKINTMYKRLNKLDMVKNKIAYKNLKNKIKELENKKN